MATPGRGRFSAALVLLVILAAANPSQGHADYLHKHHSHGDSNSQAERPLAGVASEDRKLELFPQNPQGATLENSPDVRAQDVLPQARTVDGQQGRTRVNYTYLVEGIIRRANDYESITWPGAQHRLNTRLASLKNDLFKLKGHLALMKDFKETLPALQAWHRRMQALNTSTTEHIAATRDVFVNDFRNAEAYNDVLSYYVANQLMQDSSLQNLMSNMPHSRRLLYETFPVRLARGPNYRVGELEVKIGKHWAGVCRRGADRIYDVVCNHAFYLSLNSTEDDYIGDFNLDNTLCTGVESHVLLCRGTTKKFYSCGRKVALNCN